MEPLPSAHHRHHCHRPSNPRSCTATSSPPPTSLHTKDVTGSLVARVFTRATNLGHSAPLHRTLRSLSEKRKRSSLNPTSAGEIIKTITLPYVEMTRLVCFDEFCMKSCHRSSLPVCINPRSRPPRLFAVAQQRAA